MNYTVSELGSGTRVCFLGKINLNDIVAAQNELHSSDSFEYRNFTVWDFSRSDTSEIKRVHLLLPLAHDIGANYTHSSYKIAFITQDIHWKNILKEYINDCKDFQLSWEFRIFSEEAGALRWSMT